jgi:hypothetical protein
MPVNILYFWHWLLDWAAGHSLESSHVMPVMPECLKTPRFRESTGHHAPYSIVIHLHYPRYDLLLKTRSLKFFGTSLVSAEVTAARNRHFFPRSPRKH